MMTNKGGQGKSAIRVRRDFGTAAVAEAPRPLGGRGWGEGDKLARKQRHQSICHRPLDFQICARRLSKHPLKGEDRRERTA